MPTDATKYTYEPLTMRSHVAIVMAVMAVVLAAGTLLSWDVVRGCDSSDSVVRTCAPVSQAVAMLVVLGLFAAFTLLLGSLLMWAPLRHRVERRTP
jgi:hypothetical protein